MIGGLDLIYFLFLLISKLRSWIVKFFSRDPLGYLFEVLSVSHSYRSMDHIYQADQKQLIIVFICKHYYALLRSDRVYVALVLHGRLGTIKNEILFISPFWFFC